MKNFRKLTIWTKGMQVVKQVYQLAGSLPSSERYGLISQMTRSAVSIPSNIAEGCGYDSDHQLRKHLDIALGSAFELETQLLIAQENFSLDAETMNLLLALLNEEQRMINSYRNKIKENPNKPYNPND